MPENPDLSQDLTESNVIFIHSKLDAMRLPLAAFRIYAHLARRSGGGTGYPGIDSMASLCCCHKETVVAAIKELEERGMIAVEREVGKRSRYTLTKPSVWKPLSKTDRSEMGNATGRKWGTPPVGNGERTGRKWGTPPVGNGERTGRKWGTHRSEMGNVRISIEGNPLKDIHKEEEKKPSEVTIFDIQESKPDPLPSSLKINGFPEAWQEWIQYRKQAKHKPYTSMGEKKQLTILARIGAKRAEAAIEHSIANGYQGIFEPKSNTAPQKESKMFLTE